MSIYTAAIDPSTHDTSDRQLWRMGKVTRARIVRSRVVGFVKVLLQYPHVYVYVCASSTPPPTTHDDDDAQQKHHPRRQNAQTQNRPLRPRRLPPPPDPTHRPPTPRKFHRCRTRNRSGRERGGGTRSPNPNPPRPPPRPRPGLFRPPLRGRLPAARAAGGAEVRGGVVFGARVGV